MPNETTQPTPRSSCPHAEAYVLDAHRQAGRQADSPDIGDIGTYIHAYTNTLTDGRTQTVKDRQDRYRQTPTDREIARH